MIYVFSAIAYQMLRPVFMIFSQLNTYLYYLKPLVAGVLFGTGVNAARDKAF